MSDINRIFRDKLNFLMKNFNGGLTNSDLSKSLASQGYSISEPYLSQLRAGVRNNPSKALIRALGEFFDISPKSFYVSLNIEGRTAHSIAEDVDLIKNLECTHLGNLLKSASDLSQESQDFLFIAATGMRELCNLPKYYSDLEIYNIEDRTQGDECSIHDEN